MKIDNLIVEFKTSFIFWYFDHYVEILDPYARYGQRVERFMLIHMMITKKSLSNEFIHYLLNVKKYQVMYDCLAVFDSSLVELELNKLNL